MAESSKPENSNNNAIRNDRKDLTRGSILDKVLLFAIPLMMTTMLQQLFNATDVAVVGRFASKEAMAALEAPARPMAVT